DPESNHPERVVLVIGVVEEGDLVGIASGGDDFSADRHLAVEQPNGTLGPGLPLNRARRRTQQKQGEQPARRKRSVQHVATRESTQIIIGSMTQTPDPAPHLSLAPS